MKWTVTLAACPPGLFEVDGMLCVKLFDGSAYVASNGNMLYRELAWHDKQGLLVKPCAPPIRSTHQSEEVNPDLEELREAARRLDQSEAILRDAEHPTHICDPETRTRAREEYEVLRVAVDRDKHRLEQIRNRIITGGPRSRS